MCPIPRREAAWARIAEDLPAATLDAVTEVVPLDAVTGLADEILAGRTRGRVVVDVNA
jgi:acrylyl-CoA reductase (NADPH)